MRIFIYVSRVEVYVKYVRFVAILIIFIKGIRGLSKHARLHVPKA